MTQIILPYPISANRYWQPVRIKPKRGSGGKERITIVPTAEAKAFMSECAWIARAAGLRSPVAGHVELHITLAPKNGICMDLDNALKVTIDALKGVAYIDDAQVRRIHAERVQPDGKGSLIVNIIEIGPPQQAALASIDLDMPTERPMRVVACRADGKPF